MIRPAIIFSIFSALLFATNAVAECQLQQQASLDMTTLPNGIISIPVKVAGKEQRFMFSIANGHSSVVESYAASLGLETQDLRHGATIGYIGKKVTQKTYLPDIQLGTSYGKNVEVVRVPDDTVSAGLVGVIGLDILSKFDMEIDFAHNKINLYAPSQCKTMVYWADSYAQVRLETDPVGHIAFKAKLDGQEVLTGFTIEQHGDMDLRLAMRLFHFDERSPDLKQVTTVRDVPIYRYPFKSLSVEGITINNPVIDLAKGGGVICDGKFHDVGLKRMACFSGSDLTIGMSVLRALHLWFAFGDNRLYLTAADAHK